MKRTNLTIIFFTAFILVLFGLVFPKIKNYQEISQQISRKKVELQELQEYAKFLEDSSKKIEEFSPKLAKIDLALPEEPFLPDFLLLMQDITSQSGVVYEDFSVGGKTAVPDKKNIFQTTFNFRALGSYQNIKNLLSNLEKSARLIKIDNISLNIAPNNLISAQIGIRIYSR